MLSLVKSDQKCHGDNAKKSVQCQIKWRFSLITRRVRAFNFDLCVLLYVTGFITGV